MRSAERLACPETSRVGSVGTYVLSAYRSPVGLRTRLMPDGVAGVRIAPRPGAGTGVGNAVKHPRTRCGGAS
jgi:hypothetical protein